MQRAHTRGYTMTELVVVLAIILLICAAVFPVLGPLWRRNTLNAAASTVADAFRAARAQAIITNTKTTLSYPGGRRLIVTCPNTYDVTWSDRVNVASTRGLPVLFHEDGSCEGTAEVVIFHESAPTVKRRVAITLSGQVTIAAILER